MELEIILDGRTEFSSNKVTKIEIEHKPQCNTVEITIIAQIESKRFNYISRITGYIDIEDYEKKTQMIIRWLTMKIFFIIITILGALFLCFLMWCCLYVGGKSDDSENI